MAGTADPRLSTRRALALLAGMLLASCLVWLSLKTEPSEPARAEGGPGGGSAGSAGQARWSTGSPPLSATAGPQRFLGGDWTVPGADGDRGRRAFGTPPPAVAEAGRGEAHVVPQANRVGEQLRGMRPLDAPEPFRRSFAGSGNGSPIGQGSSQAASTQTARATPDPEPAASGEDRPPEPAQPPAPKRRLFIPIPDPKGGGIREAREQPRYKTEAVPTTTTQGGSATPGIDIDKGLARPAGDGFQQAPSSGTAFDYWRDPSGKRELQRIGPDTFRVPPGLSPDPRPRERSDSKR